MGDACQSLPETINHCFAQVQLDSDWVCVDATLDAGCFEKFFVPYGVSWGIDWDGMQDLRLYIENIVGPVQSIEDIDAAIRQNRIDCLVGVPSEMAALSQHSDRKRIPPGQIKSIWLGTQNRRCSVSHEIGRALDCQVFQHYGASEMCPGGGVQCRVRDGFHLREADLLVEIVDPETAKPVADGTCGEVVVTTLTQEAMPLIRYRTGHRAFIMASPCPCGTVLRRLQMEGNSKYRLCTTHRRSDT